MDAMDVKSYCEGLKQDLTVWKARINDISGALGKMPPDKKTKLTNSAIRLHQLVDEIEGRMDKLEKECPVEWGPEKVELEKKVKELQTSCELVWPDVSPDDLE